MKLEVQILVDGQPILKNLLEDAKSNPLSVTIALVLKGMLFDLMHLDLCSIVEKSFIDKQSPEIGKLEN